MSQDDLDKPVEKRRAEDERIKDIHFMVGQIVERTTNLSKGLEKHVEWSEQMSKERDKAMRAIDDRIRPLEELHETVMTVTRVTRRAGWAMVAPSALGIGGSIWYFLQKMIGHHTGPPNP